jgi:hypothetical protein
MSEPYANIHISVSSTYNGSRLEQVTLVLADRTLVSVPSRFR